MAKIFAQDVIEIAVVGTVAGRPHVNVLHVRNDEAGGSDVSKVEDFRNNWQDHIVPNLTTAYTLSQFEWRSLDPSEGDVGTISPDPAKPVAGLGTDAAAPPNVAYLVKKETSGRQRGQRDGRMFLSGISEVSIDQSGIIAGATVNAIQDRLNLFVSGVNDSNWAGTVGSGLVVLNTTPESRAPGLHEVTLTTRPVISMKLDPMVSTQRDRLR